MEYHEGCNIKIKVKTDNVARGNKTDTSFVFTTQLITMKMVSENLRIVYLSHLLI